MFALFSDRLITFEQLVLITNSADIMDEN